MDNKTFVPDLNVGDILTQAWEYTKKHFFPVFLIVFISGMVNQLPGSYYNANYFSAFLESGGALTEEQWQQYLIDSDPIFAIKMFFGTIIACLICWFIKTYLDLVCYRMILRGVFNDNIDLQASIKGGTRGYWFFFGCMLLYGIILAVGFMFCIIPGIFLAVRLMFIPLMAAHKPELSVSEVFSRSWKMTDGHFWELLLLGILAGFICVVGLLCCCIGIFPAVIIIYFMYAEAYRRLLGENVPQSDDAAEKNSRDAVNNDYVKSESSGYMK